MSSPVRYSSILTQIELSRALRAEAARLWKRQSELARKTRKLRGDCRVQMDQLIAVCVEMRASVERVRKNDSLLTSMGF